MHKLEFATNGAELGPKQFLGQDFELQSPNSQVCTKKEFVPNGKQYSQGFKSKQIIPIVFYKRQENESLVESPN